MAMIQRIGKSLRSAVRDVVLIVVSILIAFLVDAAWSNYRETGDTRAILVALKSDFAENQTALLNRLEAWRRRVATGRRLQEMQRLDRQLVPSDSALLFVYSLQNYSTFDPSEGALRTLEASGQLDRIESSELKSLLLSWPGWVQDLKEEEADNRAATLLIQERLAQIGVTGALSRGIELCEHEEARICVVEEVAGTDVGHEVLDRVVHDPMIGELLARRMLKALDLLFEGHELVDRQGRIIELLEAELDRIS